MTMREIRLARHVEEDAAEALVAFQRGDMVLLQSYLHSLARETRNLADILDEQSHAAQEHHVD